MMPIASNGRYWRIEREMRYIRNKFDCDLKFWVLPSEPVYQELWERAYRVGKERCDESIANKRVSRFPEKYDGEFLDNHVLGAMGEACCCYLCNQKWNEMVNGFRNVPDMLIGKYTFEIRTSPYCKLKIKENDKCDAVVAMLGIMEAHLYLRDGLSRSFL